MLLHSRGGLVLAITIDIDIDTSAYCFNTGSLVFAKHEPPGVARAGLLEKTAGLRSFLQSCNVVSIIDTLRT